MEDIEEEEEDDLEDADLEELPEEETKGKAGIQEEAVISGDEEGDFGESLLRSYNKCGRCIVPELKGCLGSRAL